MKQIIQLILLILFIVIMHAFFACSKRNNRYGIIQAVQILKSRKEKNYPIVQGLRFSLQKREHIVELTTGI
jgi:hypothetical protein